jgi:DNA-directed RNA polymerase subunit omega
MVEPSIDYLTEKVDSKYTLAVLGAKRARELMLGTTPLINTKSNKPVTIALEEIGLDKITYERTKNGIK